ncbi:hypothetical protein AB3N59_05995 [Leptospira sp. WS92.C1]
MIDILIRKSALYPFQKRLYVDSKKIQYGDQLLFCHEVEKVRYGVIQLYVNGIKANRMYEIGLKGRKDQSIQINFQSMRLFFTNQKKEDQYLNIIDCLWTNVTQRLTEEAIENLENGRSFQIENLEVTPKGVNMHITRWFRKNENCFVEWKDLRKYSQEGYLHLYSESEKKAQIKINYQKVWNAPVLSSLLSFLWQDGRAYELANSHDRF